MMPKTVRRCTSFGQQHLRDERDVKQIISLKIVKKPANKQSWQLPELPTRLTKWFFFIKWSGASLLAQLSTCCITVLDI